MNKQNLLFIILLAFVNLSFGQVNSIDLSGNWNFRLDSLDIGEKQEFFNKNLPLNIKLPGTTDEAKYGKEHIPGTLLYKEVSKPEIWGLSRNFQYIGKAWYQKTVDLPPDWEGKQVSIELERCMWQTKLWINGKYVGEEHSLCIPHQFDISSYLRPGKNVITLSVDNSPYVHLGSWSHGYSPGIQTVWNGVVGDIKLLAEDPICLDNIQIYPSLKKQHLKIEGNILKKSSKLISGEIEFVITDKNNKQIIVHKEKFKLDQDSVFFQTTIPLENKLQAWDEFTPNLYQLHVKSSFGKYSDNKNIDFGVRDIEVQGNRFIVNGNKVFMRGEHDSGSFPITGYPSMEKSEWLRIFKIGKEHGFNHWRFHSWCPPEAAFEAADEIGIYLQPELTLFSQTWENTLVGTDSPRDDFLFEELQKLLKTYGNHPSFMFMCMGNELKGDTKVLEKWVAWGKKHDPRHWYAGNANLEAMGLYKRLDGDDFQVAHAGKYKRKRVSRRMFNYFNKEQPNTSKDYSHTLKRPFNKWPIISHEVGQWTVYPDFSEIEKYTGVLSARNFEVFQGRLLHKGMLEQAPDFLNATGKLSSILYREEMERLLRTPGMGGYQLLDLRDYQAQGSALVGILNAFWESKGFISAKEFRESNNSVTLLLRMDKRIWLNNESFKAELVIPNYSASELNDLVIDWEVSNSGKEIFSGKIKGNNIQQGEVEDVGKISFNLSGVNKATKFRIHLAAPELGIENNYDIWVYPKVVQKNESSQVIIATEASPELLQKIENGASVLLVPNDGFDAERMAFTTPFWSTILFSYQTKTMGIFCDPNHPVFNDFPTEYHSNWQWWDLTHDAYVVRLNQTEKDYIPIVQVIDHPVRNDKLGAIVETQIGKGKLLVSTLDILSNLSERPAARQLKQSILNYMESEEFNPSEVRGIKEAFFNDRNNSKVIYNKISSSNENPEFPGFFAFDGDEKTWWQTMPQETSKINIDLELKDARYITGCSILSKENTIQGKIKIYVFDDKDKMGEAIIIGNGELNSNFDAESWDNGFTIQKGKKGKYIQVEIEPKGKINDVIKINEIQWIFGD